MGVAQASLCCCWERQKLPREFSPKEPPPPPPTNELAATPAAAAGGEDDEEVEFELRTRSTFLEYRETRSRSRRRSRSVPRNFRPCRQRVEAAETGNVEANVSDQLRQPPTLPPMDSPFEPFLTPEMVSAERRWKREVLGRLAWRNVPPRPHSCANTCTQCCQLFNESWRLAACAAARIPGQADPCRDLEILPGRISRSLQGSAIIPLLPEEEEDDE